MRSKEIWLLKESGSILWYAYCSEPSGAIWGRYATADILHVKLLVEMVNNLGLGISKALVLTYILL